MMLMSFKFVDNVSDFLVKGWNAKTALELFGTCCFMALCVVFLEALKCLQAYLQKQSNLDPLTYGQNETTASQRSPLLRSLIIPSSIDHIRQRKINYHVCKTVAHFFQIIFGYVVMLAVMSYNAWIFVAVVFGACLGFFIFGAIRDAMLFEEKPQTKKQEDSDDLTGSLQRQQDLSYSSLSAVDT